MGFDYDGAPAFKGAHGVGLISSRNDYVRSFRLRCALNRIGVEGKCGIAQRTWNRNWILYKVIMYAYTIPSGEGLTFKF